MIGLLMYFDDQLILYRNKKITKYNMIHLFGVAQSDLLSNGVYVEYSSNKR